MSDSILKTIRKLVGAGDSTSPFDTDLIIHINSILMVLNQLGVGKDGYTISVEDETWSEFLDGRNDLAGIKTYVQARVRLLFDPPQNSSVTQALNDTIREFEWRLYAANNPENTFKE